MSSNILRIVVWNRLNENIMTKTNVEANKKEINKKLAAALEYAQRGWKVFPLHYPTNGSCSCGKQNCSSIGKHPFTKNGLKDTTINKEKIHQWCACRNKFREMNPWQ